jgi:hypothetical protein
VSWKLNTFDRLMPPDLTDEDGVSVEMEDDGALWIDAGSDDPIYRLHVPAEDMARLRAAWDERQEQLRREKGLPELEAEPDDGP